MSADLLRLAAAVGLIVEARGTRVPRWRVRCPRCGRSLEVPEVASSQERLIRRLATFVARHRVHVGRSA